MIRPKHLVEYGLLRGFTWLINALPRKAALGAGWTVAAIGHCLLLSKARESRRRIRQVFGPAMPEREVCRIAWRSWRNLVLNGVELMRLPSSTPESVQACADYDPSFQLILDHAKTGQGGTIATIHMGSWEMMSILCTACGIRMFTVVARQSNPLVNDCINRMRAMTGLETIQRGPSVMKGIISRIRKGMFFAILPDVRSRIRALPIQFLGGTAQIALGLGMIARYTLTPIFPVVMRRVGLTRHNYKVFPPVLPDLSVDKGADVARMTQEVFDIFDRSIRETPDQWFWQNSRWILDPIEANRPRAGEVVVPKVGAMP